MPRDAPAAPAVAMNPNPAESRPEDSDQPDKPTPDGQLVPVRRTGSADNRGDGQQEEIITCRRAPDFENIPTDLA